MSAAVYLSDQQSLLSRFTQGLAGRYLHLKSVSVLTGTFRPDVATTDGLAIYLPESVDQFEVARHNLGVYRVAILHQLGYYEFGTFEFSIEQAGERLDRLPDRSPASITRIRRSDDRPVDLELFFDRFEYPGLARKLFLLLEDFRIDSRLILPYPGIEQDLRRVMSQALAMRSPLASGRTAISRLLDSMLEYSLGASAAALISRDMTGRLGNLLDQMQRLSLSSTDVYDTAGATLDCYHVIVEVASAEARQTDAQQSVDAHLSSADGETVSLVSAGDLEIAGADFRGDLIPELVQRRIRLAELMAETDAVEALGEHMSPQSLAEHLENFRPNFDSGRIEDFPPHSESGQASQSVNGQAAETAAPRPDHAEGLARLIRDELDSRRNRAHRDQSVLRRAFGETRLISRSYYYDEWDYLDQCYRKGWCRLYEQRLQGDDYQYFRAACQRHRLLALKIENQLRRIRAESLARVKRVADGDELDLDQLLTAVVDRRAGRMPDDRVYSRKQRTKREVAAAFLLDMSASTDDAVPDPEAKAVELVDNTTTNTLTHDWSAPPSTRRVIDVEKEALVLISEALAMLGDAFAIYGFSGYGREEVEFYVAKEFDEALSATAKAALAEMKPRRSTRMGPAIRHTVRRLQQQDAPLKVLIILSDGFPQDFDYGPDRNDHEYGIQDTAKAIKEAEQRNIATFCITVDQSGHDYLRRMCAEDRYLVIDEIESLPDELSKIYQLLTV